jgi:hypothetical protein
MILRRVIIEADLICALARTLAEEWARSYSVKRILNLGWAVAPAWNCSSQRLTTFEAREQLESGSSPTVAVPLKATDRCVAAK